MIIMPLVSTGGLSHGRPKRLSAKLMQDRATLVQQLEREERFLMHSYGWIARQRRIIHRLTALKAKTGLAYELLHEFEETEQRTRATRDRIREQLAEIRRDA